MITLLKKKILPLAVALAAVGGLLAGTVGIANAAEAKPACSTGTLADKAVCQAKLKLGKPYVWGAEGPNSFDCSGLVWYAYKHAGLNWNRTTTDGQYAYKAAWRHPVSERKAGDILFFNWDGGSIDHTALYLGGNKILQAPHTGGHVEIVTMDAYHRSHLVSRLVRPVR